MSLSDIPEKIRKERAMDLLKMVGLDQYYKKLPSQLSGGQKQRVAIARSLANNPTILLADEPTGALDKESAEIVLDILKRIAESGKLVIIVTHSERVAKECSRIVKLSDGKVVSDTTQNKLRISSSRDKEIKPKNINPIDIYKISYKNLLQTKNRSFLVSIGIAIGLAAVILILCLSSGLSNYVNDVFVADATSLQVVVTKATSTKFSTTELETIFEIEGIKSITKTTALNRATYDNYTYDGSVSVIYPVYDSFAPSLLYGILPVSGQIVISKTLAEEITSDNISDCLNTTLEITYNDHANEFIISGIYEDTSTTNTSSYIYNSDINLFFDSTTPSTNLLYITIEDSTYVSAVLSDLTALNYTTNQLESSAETVLDYIDMGTNVLTGIGGISMLVSAIMIFIVLYISVSERMKEIGILRAVGARKKDIRKMFIFEAGILGLWGGLIGCALSLAITIITNIVCMSVLSVSLISYEIGFYALGILVSILIGILAGIAPAIRASNLDPVEALRAE